MNKQVAEQLPPELKSTLPSALAGLTMLIVSRGLTGGLVVGVGRRVLDVLLRPVVGGAPPPVPEPTLRVPDVDGPVPEAPLVVPVRRSCSVVAIPVVLDAPAPAWTVLAEARRLPGHRHNRPSARRAP